MTQQTACPAGHPFPENLRRRNKWQTYCRICRSAERRITLDRIAVERAITGDQPPHLNSLERAAAIERLNARGLSAQQIANRVGCSRRTVIRHRTRA